MLTLASLGLLSLSAYPVTAQSQPQAPSDPGVAGPPLELVHSYFDSFPTGIAVSREGRLFSNYPSGLDANNTHYQVAELDSDTTETPFPSAEVNSPPGGPINYTTYPPSSANYQEYLIGVQSVAVDPLDRLYILDTGRASLPNGTLTYATYGGPKMVRVDLTSNAIDKTFVFPPDVAYPDSYLNDVRVDLRPNVTESGQGIAYITDSSNEGRNGIVIIDLGTGQAWRHLDGDPRIKGGQQISATIWGEPYYSTNMAGNTAYSTTGSDGIAIADNGDTLFFSKVATRYLYSIPTERLRDRSTQSELMAQASIRNHGEKGLSDGLTEDTNNYIYCGAIGENAINIYSVNNATVSTYVRDPRIGWTDTMWIASDGYLYFTQNQLFRSKSQRQRPFGLFRVPTADGGARVSPLNLTGT